MEGEMKVGWAHSLKSAVIIFFSLDLHLFEGEQVKDSYRLFLIFFLVIILLQYWEKRNSVLESTWNWERSFCRRASSQMPSIIIQLLAVSQKLPHGVGSPFELNVFGCYEYE